MAFFTVGWTIRLWRRSDESSRRSRDVASRIRSLGELGDSCVGGDRQDLVMSNEKGQGIIRLTQNQGSNTYPACSPDGRLLAFFSTRRKQPRMYMMSLKRWKTQKLASQYGESLRWAPLPPPPPDATP